MTISDTRESHPNIALLQRAVDALRRRDFDACLAMMSSDFIINVAGDHQRRGHQAWLRNIDIMFSAFPDLEIEVEDMFAADDKVAMRVRFKGTHDGNFMGLQPSGRRIDYQSNELYRISDGKFAEEWICSDSLTLMTQVGAVSGSRLVAIWLAGWRVWFAAGAGVVLGALLVLLFQLALG